MTRLEKIREASEGWQGGKSLCECGHSGDGKGSQHMGAIGHGPCAHPGCACRKFTWAGFLPAFEKMLSLIKDDE